MELTIDERIRDYVFIPLLILMFMIGILRSQLTKILRGGAGQEVKITQESGLKDLSSKNMVARSKRVRLSNQILSPESFAMRQKTLASPEIGTLRKVIGGEQPNAMDQMMNNPAMNPSMMGGMLKNNLLMTATQIG